MPPWTTSLPPASLSLSPVSQRRIPLGWRTRKQEATTVAGRPSSSPVSAKALMSLTRIRPQSIAYSRTPATASSARAAAAVDAKQSAEINKERLIVWAIAADDRLENRLGIAELLSTGVVSARKRLQGPSRSEPLEEAIADADRIGHD